MEGMLLRMQEHWRTAGWYAGQFHCGCHSGIYNRFWSRLRGVLGIGSNDLVARHHVVADIVGTDVVAVGIGLWRNNRGH
jgi:hypothetical protein